MNTCPHENCHHNHPELPERGTTTDARISPDLYVHSTGFWQEWTSRLTGRVPFALCGMWLGAEPGVEYPEPDGPSCPACGKRVTVRQWFRLPKAERIRRATAFRVADWALNSYWPPDGGEDETYLALNGRVWELEQTVPWWVSAPALPHVAEDIARWWRR